MKPDEATDHVRRMLARSSALHVISLLFASAPHRRAEVTALLDELSDDALRRAALTAVRAPEGEMQELFGPGGSVSPREVAYSREDPGRILADLQGFYEAFAYQPPAREPADHFSTEAGYLGYLELKSAFAWASREDESWEVAEKARGSFFSAHFGPFARAFSLRLLELPDHHFLDLAGLLHEQIDRIEISPAADRS